MSPDALLEIDPQSCGSILQLCGRQLGTALEATDVPEFLKSALAEMATELGVQWVSILRRIPGPDWENVHEHGRFPLESKPRILWDEALDREMAGADGCGDNWTALPSIASKRY